MLTAGTGPDLEAASPDRRALPFRLSYIVLLALGIAICRTVAVPLPGANVTAAPLFYLLALRLWGPLPGLLMVIFLTVPLNLSLPAWGMMLFAVLHLLFIWCWRKRRLMLAESSAIYQLAALPLAALCLIDLRYQSQLMAFTAMVLFPVINILFAAVADVLLQNFELSPVNGLPVARRSRSLDGSLRAMINVILILLFNAALFSEAGTLKRLESGYRTHINEFVRHLPADPMEIDRVMDLDLYEGTSVKIYVSSQAHDFPARAAHHLPACERFLYGSGRNGVISDLLLWKTPCEIERVQRGDRTVMVASALSNSLIQRYRWAGGELLMLTIAALIALAYRFSLTRGLRTMLENGGEMIDRFGKPNLPLPPRQPFREFDALLRHFVTTNNNYVATLDERDRLAGVADGLKHSVELQLIRDISFDPESGILRFVGGGDGAQARPEPCAVQIHGEDRPFFLPIARSNAAMIEYRVAGTEALESFLVTLRQNVDDYAWEWGSVIKLRQPERLRELIVRQARLVDLGSMVAAIGHEVKQPLFTIAMAAESIQIILRKNGAGNERQLIEQCAERIAAQVDRAREIIRRISRYGRTAGAAPDVSNPATAMEMAYSFLLPLLEEQAVEAQLSIANDVPDVGVPQIALEQVLVNAIQNAVDSIASAREAGRKAGRLDLFVVQESDGVRCGIRDDGTGLDKTVGALAFDPFFTTKAVDKGSGLGLFISRQIMNDAGGTITLTSNADFGATLELWLPVVKDEAPTG